MTINPRFFCRAMSPGPLAALAAALCLGLMPQAHTADTPKAKSGQTVAAAATQVATTPTKTVEFAPQIALAEGKSTLLRLPEPVERISVGDPAIADVILLNPKEVYMLGKQVGATNLILWNKNAEATVMDISVGMDTAALQTQISQLFPGEKEIKVSAASDSLVLQGTVADASGVDRVLAVAGAFVRKSGRGSQAGGGEGGQRIVNMLSVAAPQQVMLEVKVAEISKTLLDKLGASANLSRTEGNWTYSLLSSFLSGGGGALDAFKGTNGNFLTLDAEKKDGLVKILAEPTVMAISGQEGSFLAGGKIFIPVAQNNSNGVLTITLEEKEFGVGLKFTPTVLAGGRINLKVAPEVSELSREGVGISSAGSNGRAILPVITTRRAATTVQLMDGQSFAIGGLIKNNVTQNVKAFPILGEIPVIGALFRSSDFQTDKSEVLFVVTPRLVKPLPPNYALPTDAYVEPSRSDVFLHGKMEGESEPAAKNPPKASVGGTNPNIGFEMK